MRSWITDPVRMFWLFAALVLLAVVAGMSEAADTKIGNGSAFQARPGLVLPDTVFVAQGRELNIWHAQLAPIPYDKYPFFFSITADSGSVENRSFRWTPVGTGAVDATITAYDFGGRRLESGSVVLEAVDKDAGGGRKDVMFIGDSLIDNAGDQIPAEVDTLFEIDNGGETVMVGSQSTSGTTYHEGYAGWPWSRFASVDTTVHDNPFAVPDSSRLSFTAYAAATGVPTPDYVVINLGGNDAYNAAAAGNLLDVPSVISNATAFLDTLTGASYGWPNARVLINMMPTANGLPSALGSASSVDPVLYMKNLRSLFRAYVTNFDGGRYKSNVDVCAGGLWADPIFGVQADSTAVSARNTRNERTGTNFLHPSTSGYDQVSDAVYSHLRHWYRLDTAGCENLLVDSYQFGGASWTDISTYWNPTAGQADPWGGTDATLFTATASIITGVYSNADAVTPSDSTLVLSIFLKASNLDASEDPTLRILDTTDNAFAQVSFSLEDATTGSISGTLSSYGTAGIWELDDSWYQGWLALDLSGSNRGGNEISCRFSPALGTLEENDAVLVAGLQFEEGVTEPCGKYVQTP